MAESLSDMAVAQSRRSFDAHLVASVASTESDDRPPLAEELLLQFLICTSPLALGFVMWRKMGSFDELIILEVVSIVL